jgi:hypothetical protein
MGGAGQTTVAWAQFGRKVFGRNYSGEVKVIVSLLFLLISSFSRSLLTRKEPIENEQLQISLKDGI